MGAEEEREPQQREWSRPASGSAGPIASEVSRRVSSILDAVEREAVLMRQQAKDEARRYMEYSRRHADGLVAERQRQISELSGALMESADRVLRQLDAAEPMRAAFDDLVRTLGKTAERLARKTGGGGEFVAPPFHETPAELPPRPSVGRSTPPRAAPATSTPPPAPREPAAPRHSWPSPPQPPFRPQTPAPAQPTGEGGFAKQSSPNLKGVEMLAMQMAGAGSTRGQVSSHIREALGVDDPTPILNGIFGADSPEDTRAAWTRPKAG